MSRYADVAIPVAVDKTFTYILPPDLESAALVGVRVIVPFGRKYVTGIIVGHPEVSTQPGMKPVRDVLDSAPVLTQDVLNLCRWISEYYIAPLGETLKAALPHGFSPLSKRTVHATVFEVPHGLSKTQRRLMELVLERRKLSMSEAQRRTGIRTLSAQLNALEKAGLVRLEETLPRPKLALKLTEFVRVAEVRPDELETRRHALPPRKRKARVLLQTIEELHHAGVEEIALAELLRKAGVSPAVAKEFKGSGLFPVTHREIVREQSLGTDDQTLSVTLNDDQQAALTAIIGSLAAGEQRTFLLHGVTGSGKTQVYIEAIRTCIERGRSAIVLVPEISLTPQTVRRFNTHFPGLVAVVHSRMSHGERYDVWRHALAGRNRIVIGPRSALFAPVENLGLVVVDEEHESSYKQYDSSPRYNARDAALVRARLNNAVVILGSATPSVESCYNATTAKYALLKLPSRVDNIPLPAIAIVDMRAQRKVEYAIAKERFKGDNPHAWKTFQQSSVSTVLREKMVDRLERGEGIILLQNRRGFAPFVECTDCGYSESCEQCSVTLTYHLARKHLRCHYCGSVYQPKSVCPQCQGGNLQLRGIGTQRVEEELHSLFPDARVLRMDLDTTSRKGAHERLLRKFADGQADILLGTQMVAKGLDFPRVTLVGVISADTQMLLPDFRSGERTFQLLTQVAGRSGRSILSGEVVIQTHQPGHHILQHVINHDFASFLQEEIEARKELDYPPFSRLVLVEFKGPREELVGSEAARFRDTLRTSDGIFTLLGPSPAVIARIKDQYRWHLIVKVPKSADPNGTQVRSVLRKTITEFERSRRSTVRVIVDVDPIGMM